FVTVCRVMRGGLNGVSLILNRLGHGLNASFSATEAWVAGPQIHHTQCRHSGPSNAQGHPIPIPGLDACIRMDQPAGSISLVRRPLEVSSCDGFLSGSIVFIEFDMGGGQCRSGLASVDGAYAPPERELLANNSIRTAPDPSRRSARPWRSATRWKKDQIR